MFLIWLVLCLTTPSAYGQLSTQTNSCTVSNVTVESKGYGIINHTRIPSRATCTVNLAVRMLAYISFPGLELEPGNSLPGIEIDGLGYRSSGNNSSNNVIVRAQHSHVEVFLRLSIPSFTLEFYTNGMFSLVH